MRHIFIFLFIFSLVSCKQEKVYKYSVSEDLLISRIDYKGKSVFYYGDIDQAKRRELPRIEVEYYGLDGIMTAYLVFDKENITLVGINGNYKSIRSKNEQLKLIRYYGFDENYEYIQEIKASYDTASNVILLYDNIVHEEEMFLKKRGHTIIIFSHN